MTVINAGQTVAIPTGTQSFVSNYSGHIASPIINIMLNRESLVIYTDILLFENDYKTATSPFYLTFGKKRTHA